MIRNIIFDWSGTLVDDLPAVWKATNHVLEQAGLEAMSLDRFRSEFRLPFKSFYDLHTPAIPMAQLEAWFHGHFKGAGESVTELPHARRFLEFCRQRGVRTFLLSTIHRDHFASQCAITGFDQFLDRSYIEVLDKREKILELLEENSLNPDETLFIGDMQHDIETARHGGIYSCAVLTGYSPLEQLRSSDPDLIVEHLGELLDALNARRWEWGSETSRPSMSDFPIVTVGALIFDLENRVLMIQTHKWSNLWGIPGGKIKLGEPAIEALRREIKEETDLEVDQIELVLVQDCIHSKEFYRDAHFVLLNYTCRCCGQSQVHLNSEAQEFRWVPFDQAAEMSLNTPTRTLIEAVRARQPSLPSDASAMLTGDRL